MIGGSMPDSIDIDEIDDAGARRGSGDYNDDDDDEMVSAAHYAAARRQDRDRDHSNKAPSFVPEDEMLGPSRQASASRIPEYDDEYDAAASNAAMRATKMAAAAAMSAANTYIYDPSERDALDDATAAKRRAQFAAAAMARVVARPPPRIEVARPWQQGASASASAGPGQARGYAAPIAVVAAAESADARVSTFMGRINGYSDYRGGALSRWSAPLPVLRAAEELRGPPEATWLTLSWRAARTQQRMCMLNAAHSAVLIDVPGDGSCLMHAILRAHGLETSVAMEVRRRVARDLAQTWSTLQPQHTTRVETTRTVLDLEREADHLLPTEALSAYVRHHLGCAMILVRHGEGMPAGRYYTTTITTDNMTLDAERYCVLAHRNAHWQCIGRYDPQTRVVSTLFPRSSDYVRVLANDYYARLGLPLI